LRKLHINPGFEAKALFRVILLTPRKIQVDFGQSIVSPAFQAVAKVAPLAAQTVLKSIDRNVGLWKKLGENCGQHDVLCDSKGQIKPLYVSCGQALKPDR
jgi:hypothetical protein